MNTTRRQFNLSMGQESLVKHLEIANITETSSIQVNRTDNKNKTSIFKEKINQKKSEQKDDLKKKNTFIPRGNEFILEKK